MATCSTCGVDLDDIPFERCAEHERHLNSIPEPTEDELEDYLASEFARLSQERTGDD